MIKVGVKIKRHTKRILGIPLRDGLSFSNIWKYQRLRWGPYIYKKKYSAKDIVHIMTEMGMEKGSNVFIHSSWNEFYNYTGTENDLIDSILSVIGPTGTLIMPAYPFLLSNNIFNIKKSVTKAGLLAEEFRKYPNVKRSINVQHSVCALGPLSDYLLNEHHLGDNCWDERSPYYKLSSINALVFAIGLPNTFIGTMSHCVEGILWKYYPYYRDMFSKDKIEKKYVDYDGQEKSYYCYESVKKKVCGPFKLKRYISKYLDNDCRQISNLKITLFKASEVIPIMISNGRKGIVIYSYPRLGNYQFDK